MNPDEHSPRIERYQLLRHELSKLIALQRKFERTGTTGRRLRLLRSELDLQQDRVKALANETL